ncbi:hypothetical protein BC332_26442 [Capsicum chinense]|nr:hypothetical protein BC332_26442 [Capsicum chinense]
MPPSPANNLRRRLFLLLHTRRQLLPQASLAAAQMANPVLSRPPPANSAAIDGDGQPSLHATAPSSVLQSPSFSPPANVQQPRHSLDSSPIAIPPANPFGVTNMQPFLIENDESVFRFDPVFKICIADENSGDFPNAKNNGMTDTRCESKREMKAPSLVARLMGLQSMPAGSGSKPQKASVSETWSNVADKLGARPGRSDKKDMDFEMAEIKSPEPGLQRFRAKCALTYPTRYFSPLKDEADLVGNSLDHHSTDNYLSSSPNSSSKDKVLAESVDSVDDEPLFPEPDRDRSDCETSLSTRRSCRELIHNVSGVLSKIDQLKGSKLSYAKQVILNAELIFGTTPQQQALPVEDGFSVSHFLLNKYEMFTSFLWMAFGELLGCNDPKQMSKLKGFAFDCLLEYLDSKFSPIYDSGFRTSTKLPSSMTKEILIADIIDEVEEWTQFVGLVPDELIEWDMSHSLGKCTDFEMEEYECGTEVARHILQELVDEVVLDLYSSS